MCPILDGYGVMGIFKFPYTPSCEPCLTEPAGGWCTQLGGLSSTLSICVLHGHHVQLKRVTIPNAVYIQFDLLRMGILLLETYRGMQHYVNKENFVH